jgi:WD40 repeat protein
MPDPTLDTSSREARLHEAIVAYLAAVEAGQSPDREELLSRHLDVADELRTFFADYDRMQALAEPLRQAMPPNPAETPTMGADSAAPTPSLGTVRYFGDYELLEERARGGMGVVYKARQVSLNRVVALKMILSGQLASADDVRRFRLEAEAAANLDHPNIVPIYEVGEHQGQQYFSMKLIEGGSLAQQAPRLERTPRDVAALMAKVSRAVHFAHQRGILHRDLKPANVLLDADGTPYVTDFGLAKRLQAEASLSPSGAVVGTPAYMPPEQASARKGLSTAADVYSLGAVLYECLTGRPPFQAATPLDILLQVLEKEPEPLRRLRTNLDRDLETICLKCLHKEPEHRYPSAEALAEDLERWWRGEPIQARPARPVERAFKWVKRRPAIAGLLAALVILSVTAFGVGMFQFRQTADALNEARNNLDESEKNLHLNQIALAQREVQASNFAGAEEILDRCRPEFREWEWHFLKRACRPRQRSVSFSEASRWSRDGRFLATPDDTGVRLDDALTGQKLFHFPARNIAVNGVLFSPEGNRLAIDAANPDRTVTVWDTTTGKQVGAFAAEGIPFAFGDSGKRLALAVVQEDKQRNDLKAVRIVEGATGKEVQVIRVQQGESWKKALFSPDGRYVVVLAGPPVGPGVLRLTMYLAETGQSVSITDLKGETEPVFLMSPDSRHVVLGWEGLQGLRCYEILFGKLLYANTPGPALAHSVQYSPDGKRLAACFEEGQSLWLKVWDARSGEVLASTRRRGNIQRFAFSPDGKCLALQHGTIEPRLDVWDSLTGQTVFTAPSPITVNRLQFLSDGDHILNGYDVWNLGLGGANLSLRGRQDSVLGVSFSPDGSRLATANSGTITGKGDWVPGSVILWDATTGRQVRAVTGFQDRVNAVQFNPDGTRLAAGEGAGDRGQVKEWDTAAERAARPVGAYTAEVRGLAYSPDGRQLATASSGALFQFSPNQGEVVLWDTATGKKSLTLGGLPYAVKVAFSPDGKWLAAVNPKEGKIWDVVTRTERFTLPEIQGSPIYDIAFNPDGTQVATGHEDKTVRIWDAQTGQVVRTLKGHTSNVVSVVFSPDGKRLASAGGDLERGEIKLWNPATGREVLTLRGHTGTVNCLAFDRDGYRLASGSADGTVKIWDATPLP